MLVDGACHCGRIRYQAEINPEYVVLCHCTDCQNISGAPFRAGVPVLRGCFRLQGEPSTYVKTADSGNRRVLAFCGACGSAMYSTTPDAEPAVYMLRLGSIRQRAELPPKRQGFCRSALPWAMNVSGLPVVPQ